MKNSKWRQDNSVEPLDHRDGLDATIDALSDAALELRSDFVSPGRDAEICCILRTPDKTRVVTCGTDGGTNGSSEEVGKALKRRLCFDWPDMLRGGLDSGYIWRRNFEVISHGRMYWDEAVGVVMEEARNFSVDSDENVEVCLLLRNWYRARVLTCGTDESTDEGAWNLGTVIRHFLHKLKNPARTFDSY